MNEWCRNRFKFPNNERSCTGIPQVPSNDDELTMNITLDQCLKDFLEPVTLGTLIERSAKAWKANNLQATYFTFSVVLTTCYILILGLMLITFRRVSRLKGPKSNNNSSRGLYRIPILLIFYDICSCLAAIPLVYDGTLTHFVTSNLLFCGISGFGRPGQFAVNAARGLPSIFVSASYGVIIYGGFERLSKMNGGSSAHHKYHQNLPDASLVSRFQSSTLFLFTATITFGVLVSSTTWLIPMPIPVFHANTSGATVVDQSNYYYLPQSMDEVVCFYRRRFTSRCFFEGGLVHHFNRSTSLATKAAQHKLPMTNWLFQNIGRYKSGKGDDFWCHKGSFCTIGSVYHPIDKPYVWVSLALVIVLIGNTGRLIREFCRVSFVGNSWNNNNAISSTKTIDQSTASRSTNITRGSSLRRIGLLGGTRKRSLVGDTTNTIKPVTPPGEGDNRNRNQNRRVQSVVIAIIIESVASAFLPAATFISYFVPTISPRMELVRDVLGINLSYAVTPLIFVVLSKSFRKEFFKLFPFIPEDLPDSVRLGIVTVFVYVITFGLSFYIPYRFVFDNK